MHSIIWAEILQRWKWMQTKSLVKIWLSVNFEKFTPIHRPTGSPKADLSLPFEIKIFCILTNGLSEKLSYTSLEQPAPSKIIPNDHQQWGWSEVPNTTYRCGNSNLRSVTFRICTLCKALTQPYKVWKLHSSVLRDKQ